jgi:predicted AlkP superfamily phosphohydrolase/phosphomutase
VFFMDKWLDEHGYLAYRGDDQRSYRLTRMFHLAFQRYFPNRYKEWVTSLLPGLRDQLRSYLTTARIDWQKTRAFSLGIDSTNIFINSQGRFPEGIVEEGPEYETLRDEIAERLRELVDPETGESIVERVYRREALYHGDCLSKAPDLLVTWKNFEYNTRRGYGTEGEGFMGSGLEFSDVSGYSSLQKSGTHHVQGIFMARGPHIRSAASFEGGKIIDLAPTILYLLGQTIPDDMDGRVLKEMLNDDFLSSHPIQFGSPRDLDEPISQFRYGEEEEKYIEDKLRGLGYID